MHEFEKKNAYFDRLSSNPDLRWLGQNTNHLPSAAGHDARHLHYLCPTGMVFVPCAGGISHNEAESADPHDLYDGTRVLAETLATLAA